VLHPTNAMFRVMLTSPSMAPPQRRVEDRIRELCAKTITNTGDLEPALRELSQLLRETIEHMRLSATRLLVEGKPLSEPRRRANDNNEQASPGEFVGQLFTRAGVEK